MKLKVILYVSLFQIQPESPSSDRFRMATFELPDHAYLSISKGSSSLLPFLPDTPLRFPRYLSSKPFTFSRLLSFVGQESQYLRFTQFVMDGSCGTQGFLFVNNPGSKYFRHVVYFLDCQCRVEIRVGFGIYGSHQFLTLFFCQSFVFLLHIIRTDILVFLQWNFLHRLGTGWSHPCYFRVFQIDDLCLAYHIIVIRRRGRNSRFGFSFGLIRFRLSAPCLSAGTTLRLFLALSAVSPHSDTGNPHQP